MPPLHERLRDTAEPDSESVIFGIVGSLFLLLPEAVRAQRYEVLLKDNGFCFLGALDAMSAADLQELGVVRGHALLLLRALRPPQVPPTPASPLQQRSAAAAANGTADDPNHGMAPHLFRAKCRAFPTVLTTRTWRAFLLTFVMVLRSIGLSDPVPDAVLAAGLRPSAPHSPMDAVLSGSVWDILLSVEGGLPDDILLGFTEVIVCSRDGEAAVRHIGNRMMASSDQSIATLATWFNDPSPVTKQTAVINALDEWYRVMEQLTEYGAAPSEVQQRISLMTLVGGVPQVTRAFEALQAVSGTMDLAAMVSAARRIGDTASSVASQKRAVAMMTASVDGSGALEPEREVAMVATKRRKHGRCKFHDAGHCKFGDRCRFHHIGEAGNGHPPPPGHFAPRPQVAPQPAAGEDEVAVANLAEMLSKLLKGMSASCGCSVAELVSVIIGRLQRRKTRSEESIGDGTPLGEPIDVSVSVITGAANVNEPVGAGSGFDSTGSGAAALVPVVCDGVAREESIGDGTPLGESNGPNASTVAGAVAVGELAGDSGGPDSAGASGAGYS